MYDGFTKMGGYGNLLPTGGGQRKFSAKIGGLRKMSEFCQISTDPASLRCIKWILLLLWSRKFERELHNGIWRKITHCCLSTSYDIKAITYLSTRHRDVFSITAWSCKKFPTCNLFIFIQSIAAFLDFKDVLYDICFFLNFVVLQWELYFIWL